MSDDAVTESEARRLLGAAAATIEVDDPAPLTPTGLPEPRPHRRWSVLVAVAASVVLLASAAWVVARQLGDGKQVPPEPLERPGSREHTYGPGQVPALIGYTEPEARALVRADGYRVRVQQRGTCSDPAGLVVATTPTAGEEVAPGDLIVLSVTASGSACPRTASNDVVWDLVRFARGLAGPPVWSNPSVCDDDRCVEALGVLAELSTRPAAYTDGTPLLFRVVDGYDEAHLSCLASSPDVAAGLRRVHVLSEWLVDGGGIVCPTPPLVQVDLDDSGRIADVRVRQAKDGRDHVGPLPALSPVRSGNADRFIRWARTGVDPPAFEERVRHLAGGFSPAWVDEPGDRARWSGCSGLGFPDCGIDPVARVFRADGELQVDVGLPDCGHDDNLPMAYRAAWRDVVRISEAGTACDGWYVLLWMRRDGAIYGVM